MNMNSQQAPSLQHIQSYHMSSDAIIDSFIAIVGCSKVKSPKPKIKIDKIEKKVHNYVRATKTIMNMSKYIIKRY